MFNTTFYSPSFCQLDDGPALSVNNKGSLKGPILSS